MDSEETDQPKGKRPSMAAQAFSTAAKTEPQVGRPRQLVAAGSLGVCLVFIVGMLALPRLDTPLLVALYAFVVAMPLLVVEYIAASYRVGAEPRDVHMRLFLKLGAAGAVLSAPGMVATAVGIVAVVWHLNEIVGGVLLITSGVVMVAWIALAGVGWFIDIWRTVRTEQTKEAPNPKPPSETDGEKRSNGPQAAYWQGSGRCRSWATSSWGVGQMADQWEYFMADLVFGAPDSGSHDPKLYTSRYRLRLLTAEGTQSDTVLDAPSALNDFGAQGWELVGTGNQYHGYGTGTSYLIFKRRKP